MVPAALEHPANASLRRYLAPRAHRNAPAVERPDQIPYPYTSLGTHPDLVSHLWNELPNLLPADCRFVFLNTPVLIHPASAIVFGFASGTHTYALRLPDATREQALAAGATRTHTYANKTTFDLAEIGAEWVFGRSLKGEAEWCLAAYEFAGNEPLPWGGR